LTKTFRTVTWYVIQLRNITKGNSGPNMIKRLRHQPFCYQFFNQYLDCVALLFTGNLNQCLDYLDMLFSTNLYTKTLQSWNTWMLTASLMWIAILSPNLNWRWRITESATILYVVECCLSIMSYYNLLLIFPSPPSDYVLIGRDVLLPTLQPDQRTTWYSSTARSWQHCPATRPKICDNYRCTVHFNIGKCGKINFSQQLYIPFWTCSMCYNNEIYSKLKKRRNDTKKGM
jgi:hypothetical protein